MADPVLTPQETRTSINARVLLLSQEFGQFKTDVTTKFDKISQEFTNRSDKISGEVTQLGRDLQAWLHQRQPRLNVWLPTAAVILGGFWFVLNLQLTSATKSLSDNVSRMEIVASTNATNIARIQEQIPNMMQQNADSQRDRSELNRKYDSIQERLTRNEIAQNRLDASITKSLVEVETQTRASENYANLQRKYDNTMIALLWKKAYGEDYPVYQYYPTISLRPDLIQ